MDEYVLFGQWISYTQFFLLISALSGAILYWFPVSRAYFHQGCVVFIDVVAYTLKAALNIYENENENVNTPHNTISPSRVSKTPKSQEHETKNWREGKRHHRHEYRTKNRSVYKDAKGINGDWPTVQIYPNKKLKRNRDSVIDVEWDKRMDRRKDDNVLYSQNDGPSQYYNDQLLVASVDDLQNDMGENSKKRKHSSNNNQIFHHQVHGEQDVNNVKEKVRKLRKIMRPMASQSEKYSREIKDVEEVMKLTDDYYLKNSFNQANTKWSRKNNMKYYNKPSVSMDGGRMNEAVDVDSSRLNRKFTASTKKESPIKHKRKDVELPVLETEDYVTDSECYLQPPIITDRITPMVQSAYQWVFGGCPSLKLRRRS